MSVLFIINHTYTNTHKYKHTLSNGANGLISYGDMIIIHTQTHTTA